MVIVDGGGANIASLRFALARLGVDSTLSAEPDRIGRASHVILPGVGAAAGAMRRLRAAGLDRLLPTLNQPVLGICLGMQLLFDASAEGPTDCLGLMRGRAVRLRSAPGKPVPHMGWNTLEPGGESPLLRGAQPGERAYFVHSYALPVGEYTRASTDYGTRFSACVQIRNFHGVQFHPERSGKVGARVLANFLACD
ncbi:MAG: imidazole glycerol phosphate synthase subunit HisH [Gammaproteobacteria bacterium]|nr:imidazole glycerol phosphate synthase subunit HisH [Gammaproteobacteria bacterium]